MSASLYGSTYRSIERELIRKVNEEVEGNLAAYTPSLQIQASVNGRKKIDITLGREYKYYDLASLTKILFATAATMRLVDQKKLRLDDRIAKHLAWWWHPSTRIEQILSHSAGLAWWAPFYKKAAKLKTLGEKREYLRRELAAQTLSPSKKAVYSDLDILLLGFVLEEASGEALIDIWHDLPLAARLKSLHFNPLNKPRYARKLYAPTERCPWRKRILQGEVHDDNTWALGGVSSHAGLFGTIDDVTTYGEWLLKRNSVVAKAPTIARFTKRAIPRARGDWALGFMMPTKGAASCGRHFSLESFGHTGFTGTSLWVDPRHKLVVTILSNRVHPTRNNQKFVKLRPKLHDLVFETLFR